MRNYVRPVIFPLSLIIGALVLIMLPGPAAATMRDMHHAFLTGTQDITPTDETITVTTTDDPDISRSNTCANKPADPCTLRRAIVQARNSPNKPVTIAFDLATSDENYDETSKVWVFALSGFSNAFWNPNGQVIIDGTTQSSKAGARPSASGPSVFIRGTAQFISIVFDGDNNELRGVGFQYVTLKFNGSNNRIEKNWLGLTLAGTAIQFPNDDPTENNRATIETGENTTGNIISNNTLAGGRTGAIVLRSNDSTVTGNQIGTRADGTIPAVAPNTVCRPNAQENNWFGGDGINVSGDNNDITDNVLIGMLMASSDPDNSPPPAIEATGSDNMLRNNRIGVQKNATQRWVCGIGIRLAKEGNEVQSNQIVGARGGAVGIFGSQIDLSGDGMTIQGNVIKQGAAAIFFGATVPKRYANFNPARITSIDGTIVTGSNGADGIIRPGDTFPSTCNGCTIEIFLDNTDSVVETIQSLGTTTSNASGNWTFTLPNELTAEQGLRTISTTADFGQIQNMGANTSTKVSELYVVSSTTEVYLPLVIK